MYLLGKQTTKPRLLSVVRVLWGKLLAGCRECPKAWLEGWTVTLALEAVPGQGLGQRMGPEQRPRSRKKACLTKLLLPDVQQRAGAATHAAMLERASLTSG